MSAIYLLLTVSIVVAVIFFIAFILSVKSGQYDDSYTPSVRMLFEDELVKPDKPKQIPKPYPEEKSTNTLKNLGTNKNQSKLKLEKGK